MARQLTQAQHASGSARMPEHPVHPIREQDTCAAVDEENICALQAGGVLRKHASGGAQRCGVRACSRT
jgi:hypothetical protein